MLKRIFFSIFLSFCLVFFCFPQIKEEKEEKSLELKREAGFPFKYSSNLKLLSGYDSNAKLNRERKGDIFEELIYSLSFNFPIFEKFRLSLNYDLDVLNYNEFTDFSNILNHIRVGLHRNISLFTLGGGYDLGWFYYPRDESLELLFHQGFIYISQKISPTILHKLQLEAGFKDYLNKKALAETIYSYQNSNRLDQRYNIEYSITSKVIPKLTLTLKTRFSLNDSNATYMDFYDYKAYRGSLSMQYQTLKNVYLFLQFGYLRKKYVSRRIILDDSFERETLYTAGFGIEYRLNKRNSLLLNYTYRNNHSNEPLDEYSQNVISFGWLYNF